MSGSFVVAGTGRVRATGVGGEAYAARLHAPYAHDVNVELKPGNTRGWAIVLSWFRTTRTPSRKFWKSSSSVRAKRL